MSPSALVAAVRRAAREAACDLLAARPRACFRLLGAVGMAAHRVHGVPSPGEVEAAFGPLSPARRARAARGVAASVLRNRALDMLARRRGLAAVLPALRLRGAHHLRDAGPCVIAFPHTEPATGLAVALLSLGMRALFVRWGTPTYDLPPGFEVCDTLSRTAGDAFALKRSVERLRAGVTVAIAADGGPHCREVDGRSVPVSRGPVVMSRLTGAPIVPARCSWGDGGAIEVAFEPPLAPRAAGPAAGGAAGFEDALGDALARFLVRTFARRPGMVARPHLRFLAQVRGLRAGERAVEEAPT